MSVIGQRFVLPNQFDVNAAGIPYLGGKLYFYVSGTTTPLNTYADAALTTPNPNPVPDDGSGHFGNIFLGFAPYKVTLQDENGVPIWTMDPVQVATGTNISYTGPGASAVARSGASKWADWVSAADYGVVGDGATDDTANFMDAVAEAITLGVPLMPIGTSGRNIRITSNQTIGCPLNFWSGGQLQPASGVTLTLVGAIAAPETAHIFAGAGTCVPLNQATLGCPVEWWGASTAAADNTAAVNSAIVAAGAGGACPLLFHGAYTFTGTIQINVANISLVGRGRGATGLLFTNGSANCIVVGTVYTNPIGYTVIQDLFIQGISKTGGNAISLTSAYNSIIRDVLIFDVPNGMYFQFINDISCEDIIILIQNASNYGYAIKWFAVASAAQTANVILLSNVTINCNATGADGIVVDGACQTLRLQSVGVIHANNGLSILNSQASNSFFPQFVFANDLEIDGALLHCLNIQGGRHLRFVNCDFFNNFGGTTDDNTINISADGAASVTSAIWLTACRIAGAQRSGLYCEAKDVDITGCYVGDNSLAGSGDWAGIRLGNAGGANGAATSVRITGGNIGSVFGDIGNQSYGVTVASGVTRVTITGVDFSNCVTGAIQDSTGGLGNVMWSGCIDINGNELANRLPILPGDAGSPAEGMIYENASTHALRVCLNGTLRTVTVT